MTLLENYRKVVVADPAFKDIGLVPGAIATGAGLGVTNATGGGGSSGAPSGGTVPIGKGRASADNISRAVQAMVNSGHFGWLKDLFRLVFGFGVEDALGGGGGGGNGGVNRRVILAT